MKNIKEKIVIIGGKGNGTVIASTIEGCIDKGYDIECVGFLNDVEKVVNGYPVLGGIKNMDWKRLPEEYKFIYAMSNIKESPQRFQLLLDLNIPIERFESDFTQYEIFEGDILITMMGTTGKSKVFKKEFKRGILDSHLLRLRFKKQSFISELFVTILQESDYVFHQLKLNSKGSIMEGLNSSIVKEITLLTPSISEQQQIVEYLDRETQKIESLIEKETQRTDLLKEYRQSLISEVVTGKVDVRDYNG